ncbi:unnamed protein product [Musa acuminata var. zebrina]
MAMIKKSVEDEKKKKQDKKEKKRHKDHHHSRSKDDKRSLRRYSDSGTDLFPSLEFDQAFVSRVDFIRQRFHPCPFTTVLNRFFVLDLNPRMMDAFHRFFFDFFRSLRAFLWIRCVLIPDTLILVRYHRSFCVANSLYFLIIVRDHRSSFFISSLLRLLCN